MPTSRNAPEPARISALFPPAPGRSGVPGGWWPRRRTRRRPWSGGNGRRRAGPRTGRACGPAGPISASPGPVSMASSLWAVASDSTDRWRSDCTRCGPAPCGRSSTPWTWSRKVAPMDDTCSAATLNDCADRSWRPSTGIHVAGAMNGPLMSAWADANSAAAERNDRSVASAVTVDGSRWSRTAVNSAMPRSSWRYAVHAPTATYAAHAPTSRRTTAPTNHRVRRLGTASLTLSLDAPGAPRARPVQGPRAQRSGRHDRTGGDSGHGGAPRRTGSWPVASSVSFSAIRVGVGRVILVAGVLVLLFIPYLLWGTGLITARAQSDLRQQFVATQRLHHRSAKVPPPTHADGATGRRPTVAAPAVGQPGGHPVHPEDLAVDGHRRRHRRRPAAGRSRALPRDPATGRGRQRRHRRSPDDLPPSLLQPQRTRSRGPRRHPDGPGMVRVPGDGQPGRGAHRRGRGGAHHDADPHADHLQPPLQRQPAAGGQGRPGGRRAHDRTGQAGAPPPPRRRTTGPRRAQSRRRCSGTGGRRSSGASSWPP